MLDFRKVSMETLSFLKKLYEMVNALEITDLLKIYDKRKHSGGKRVIMSKTNIIFC